MAYKTIDQLPQVQTLQVTDNFLVSSSTTSFQVSLQALNNTMVNLNAGTPRTFTNVTISDISNIVSADSTHISGICTQALSFGTPCIIQGDSVTGNIQISACAADDIIQGFSSETYSQDSPGLIISGGLMSYDLTGFNTGPIYWQLGALTNTPNPDIRKQHIGQVLINGVNGVLLISDLRTDQVASDVGYFNQNSGLLSTQLQDVIDEIVIRIKELENSAYVQAIAPISPTEGDTWYNTSDKTFNVYREFPINSGTFNWEQLVLQNNYVLDGGTW